MAIIQKFTYVQLTVLHLKVPQSVFKFTDKIINSLISDGKTQKHSEETSD